MESAATDQSRFRVGAVLSRSIRILLGHPVVFGSLALVMTLPLLIVSGDVVGGSATVSDAGARLAGEGVAAVVITVALIALLVLGAYALATCTMVHGTFQALRDRPVGFVDCIRHGLPAALRALGIAIVTTLMFVLIGGLATLPGLGFALIGGDIGRAFLFAWSLAALVITGGMIYSAFWVATPVAVVEGLGVIASMRRAAALTKGHRWRLFGILASLALLNMAADAILSIPFATPEGAPPGTAEAVLQYATTAFFTAWGAIAVAVAYHDLRVVKEGIGVNEIAAVFD